mmetsp:Transcript_6551/g.24484  ORF Transcript_6551/g.24484 Transcript_6551/m.24484 type:complete len:279 (-) Transcript_6551:719-1555(-)
MHGDLGCWREQGCESSRRRRRSRADHFCLDVHDLRPNRVAPGRLTGPRRLPGPRHRPCGRHDLDHSIDLCGLSPRRRRRRRRLPFPRRRWRRCLPSRRRGRHLSSTPLGGSAASCAEVAPPRRRGRRRLPIGLCPRRGRWWRWRRWWFGLDLCGFLPNSFSGLLVLKAPFARADVQDAAPGGRRLLRAVRQDGCPRRCLPGGRCGVLVVVIPHTAGQVQHQLPRHRLLQSAQRDRRGPLGRLPRSLAGLLVVVVELPGAELKHQAPRSEPRFRRRGGR